MEHIYKIGGTQSGSLQLAYLDTLNFAMARRGIPALYTCQLSNLSNEAWESVELSLEGGSWLKPSSYHIDRLEAGATVACTNLRLEVEIQNLLTLTEGIDVTATLTLSIGGEPAGSYTLELRLEPYNHWAGLSVHPDTLASFVTPNHPMIPPILVEAARFMERWTGSSALTEYQSKDPNMVRKQVAAVYEALRAQALVYASPPASFEQMGQRIRLVDQVLTEKLGTCLDLTLLFASCLEAMGLRPLLVLVPGHIFLGVWLEEKYYPSTIGDDESVLQKGIASGINELVLVESTALTSSEAVGFEVAVEQACFCLSRSARLELFVDVFRCRLAGIRPLPQRSFTGGAWQIEQEGIQHEYATDTVYQIEKISQEDLKGSGTITKQTLWERKLLDLTLRNSLINIRLGKRIIPLITSDVGAIEDLLQAGKQYSLQSKPTDWLLEETETGLLTQTLVQAKEYAAFIAEESKAGRIYSYLSDSAFDDTIKTIYRTSRNALEENGANSLFLALGLLEWYESEISTKPRFAPILLLPVDILRKNGGYTIRLRDEDLMLNITLIELLKQEFALELTGLDPLPHDEQGVDVHKVLTIVRSHIHDMKGWQVLDDALLGLFSFSKFVMWNDIHSNASKLAEHPIVQGLMNQRLSPDALLDLPVIDARDIDHSHAPSDHALPIDVDSSQLEAILEAGQGRSFVLHGPPGTGKSQTITNMIANALYQGKRVLFVAEKMAALSVVQKRLERIGLDPFCLELHSNKATKTHILAQLKQALELEHYLASPEYAHTSSELLSQRQELIAYINALHQVRHLDLSLYDCISRYHTIPAEPLEASKELVDNLSADSFKAQQELISQADTIRQVSGEPSTHPLRELSITEFNTETNRELTGLIEQWRNEWSVLLSQEAHILSERIGFKLLDNRDSYLCLAGIAEAIQHAPTLSFSLISLTKDEAEEIEKNIQIGQQHDELGQRLTQLHSPSLLETDAQALTTQWQDVEKKWFIPRFFARRSLFKRLRSLGANTTLEGINSLLGELRHYQELGAQLRGGSKQLTNLFGTTREEQIHWETMLQSLRVASKLQAILISYAQKRQINLMELLQGLRPHLDGNFYLVKQSLEPQLRTINQATIKLREIEQRLEEKYLATFPIDNLGTTMMIQADRWLDGLSELKNWHLWCVYKQKLEAYNLSEVVRLLENGCAAQEATQAYARGIYRRQAEMIIDEDERLRLFNGLLFEQTIEKYRQLTKQFMELTKHELYARLASRVPRMTMEPVASSELGILKRNIANGGRGTSIRKLMDQIPNLLMRLCPCMLMSPMSAAQYLSLESEPFDLVIFDEASQMPTSEAVGAIARGRSLVVVGDPKQMPPTSFFSTSQVDEEEVELDDMESILDECIALSMPSRYLTWHYRSKHESLIAFSNRNYYEGKLFTFPSIDNRQSKVSLVRINGVYDKGRTRSNKAEATAIVAEVLRRLRDPQLARYSIGVVSFSQVQQNLIEDLLLEALAKEPELEQRAFASEEPIFIKNLENVQGDERDIILFSVGYGPDAEGKVSMNFGPLNNKGGERRLNVAVSRSRYEMVVFSTLHSQQIDLKRTQAKGVEGLKRFLEFAESGKLIEVGSLSTLNSNTSSLASIVAEELHQRGHQVDLHIGSSPFRIDLGIVDPRQPERYLLGILFDGTGYYQTKTARDREIVQPTVLGLLKWQTMRIWSVDWFENKERVLARIEERIKNPQEPFREPTPQTIKSITLDLPSRTSASPAETNRRARPYEVTNISARQSGGIDKMLSSKVTVAGQVRKIIETEYPITSNLIAKRLAGIWQLTRITPRVQALIESILIDYHLDPHTLDQQEVYWLDEASAEGYCYYRTDSKRDILDCPLIEIMNAALAVLEEQISMSRADLKRSIASQLGFSRMSGNLETMAQLALDTLISKCQIETVGDNIRLKN